VRVWDLATGHARVLEGHGARVNAMAITPNGRTAVSGSYDRTVRVWDLANGQILAKFHADNSVTSRAASESGQVDGVLCAKWATQAGLPIY